MKVLKFGGSSVASPARVRAVADIIRGEARHDELVVVVSAFQGVTNQLIEAARRAEGGDDSYRRLFASLARRHRSALQELHRHRPPQALTRAIDGELDELREVLQGISLLQHCPPRALDLVASFGERLSARILASYLHRRGSAVYVDARQVIMTDDHFTQAAVLFEDTNRAVRSVIGRLMRGAKRAIPVVTGFIGSTQDGRTTTLGRNGSDYSAAIVGAALKASAIEIWTDVDGILSADPAAVPSAFVVPQMTYEEAMELSYFGAKVLHSATLAPAVAAKIPLLIKNTMNPAAPGTLISDRVRDWEPVAKGITSIDGITLLTIRGLSMVGVPGTAERLFRSLAANSVNVILISQASSEHTICFALRSEDAQRARKSIHHEFRYEFQNKITMLDETPHQTIVAIVGEGMKGTPGVAGTVFQSLGQQNISVSAIAQGASERNISFVIDSRDKIRALGVIHEAFFEERKRLKLAVLGAGNIGAALLAQLRQQRAYLLAKGFDIEVCAIADSKHCLIAERGIDLAIWPKALKGAPRTPGPEALAHRLRDMQWTNVALVDCTASAEVVNAYPEFVRANMHIVTPNKKANVLPWQRYEALMELLQKRQKYFFYEANVGAGLPIISTLLDLIASGDTVTKIEGIFSGTLSYLFSMFDGSVPFSRLVERAYTMGYTEPDPRDDLSGADVGRKLLILARQLGMTMDLADVRTENLVAPKLRGGAFRKTFFRTFASYDRAILGRFEAARKRKKVLRYVGRLEGDRASGGLAEFPLDHPFASVKGGDNVVAFSTRRYARTPLIVQGPGAGADVTAMGVFSDLLKLLHYLP